MKPMRLLFLIAPFFLAGCALGPLMSHETARTTGGWGHHELSAGVGSGGHHVFKWNLGLLKDLDVGIQYESLSIGLRAKYAVINNQDGGFSLAVAGGVGDSIGGDHRYADLMFSYLFKRFEPYGVARVVWGRIDPVDFADEDTGDIVFSFNGHHFTYGAAILGLRFFAMEKVYFMVEGSTIFSIHNIKIEEHPLMVSAGLGLRF